MANLRQSTPLVNARRSVRDSDAFISNLGDYWQQSLQDELNLRVGLDVLRQGGPG